MKREILKKLGIGFWGSVLLVGCATHTRPVVVTPTGQVLVRETPPPPKHEEVGRAPSASYVWTPGYYTYGNSQWVWVPGEWKTPPRAGSTWVAGHWDHVEGGWVWTPGHWE
jgi:hypothetical protein